MVDLKNNVNSFNIFFLEPSGWFLVHICLGEYLPLRRTAELAVNTCAPCY